MTNATTLQREIHVDRFGLKVAALLDEQALPHDISERLRVARQQAVAQRKQALVAQVQPQTAESMFAAGSSAILGGEGSDWGSRLMGMLPLLALVVGLVMINTTVNQERATELADVDTQLLTDDLPPAAHTDPGFAQFLKFGPPSVSSNP
jgi:hypothetical protein